MLFRSAAASRFDARRSKAPTALAEFIFYDPVTETEVCVLPTTRASVFRAEFLLWLRLWPVTIGILFSSVIGGRRIFLATCLAMPLLSLLRSLWRHAEWAANQYFLLVTRDGFYERRRRGSRATLWSAVKVLEFRQSEFGNVKIRMDRNADPDGSLNVTGDFSFPISTAHGGGGSKLHEALEWGQGYDKSRWQWQVFSSGQDSLPTSGLSSFGESDVSLLIAVGNYKDLPTLAAAEQDLKLIEDAMGPVHRRTSLRDPKPLELISQLDACFRRAAGGTLVLYFSGHGLVKGSELYLMLAEGGSKLNSSYAFPLHKLLDLKEERNVNDLILILDCCFAGAGASTLDISIEKVREWFERIRMRDRTNLTLIAASKPDQSAFASSEASVFTRSLVEAAAFLSKTDGMLQLSEWYEETSKYMRGYGLPQVPVFFSMNNSMRSLRLRGAADRVKSVADRLRDEAEGRADKQRCALLSINEGLEMHAKALSPGQYELPSNKGLLLRSKRMAERPSRPLRLIEDVARYLGKIGMALFLLSCLYLLIESFLGQVEMVAVFGWDIGAIGAVAGLGSFSLGCIGLILTPCDGPLYLLLTDNGIVRATRRFTEVFPANSVLKVYTKSCTYSSDSRCGGTVRRLFIRLRSGLEKELVDDMSLDWSVKFEEIQSMLEGVVEKYVDETSRSDSTDVGAGSKITERGDLA